MNDDWLNKFNKQREQERMLSAFKEFIKEFWVIILIILIGIIALISLSYDDSNYSNGSVEKPIYTYYSFNGTEYIKKDTLNIPGNIYNKFEDVVVFNYNTMIYHEPWCEWAKECVDNCIYMEREEAMKYGRHCYVCTGEPEDSDAYEDYLEDSVPDRFQ